MYILFTDEAQPASRGKCEFWIYGGVAVPAQVVGPLVEELQWIKEATGIPPEKPIKFAHSFKPPEVETSEWIEACVAAKRMAAESKCVGIIVMVHQGVAATSTQQKTYDHLKKGLFSAFQDFLTSKDSDGVVVIDRENQRAEISLTEGLPVVGFSTKKVDVDLYRIRSYSESAVKASPLICLADLLVGSVSWSLDPKNLYRDEVARRAVQMLWKGIDSEGDARLNNFGIQIRPQTIYAKTYKEASLRAVQYFEQFI